ncbi:MAG: hypothetical protein ACKOUM_12925, partial [Sphingopyxis sp.]
MTMAQTLPPTSRDEAWRYADMAAVARLWPDLPPAQSITIPAGQADCVIIDKLPANGVVQINAK